MKDFFECLSEYLLTNEKAHSVFANRVYPILMPQEGTLPAIVYTPISSQYDDGLQRHTGFVRQIVQFTIYDTTFGKARLCGRILKAVLHDFKGDMCGKQIQATHTLTDLTSGNGTMTSYNTEEYTNVLEFEFDYMEE